MTPSAPPLGLSLSACYFCCFKKALKSFFTGLAAGFLFAFSTTLSSFFTYFSSGSLAAVSYSLDSSPSSFLVIKDTRINVSNLIISPPSYLSLASIIFTHSSDEDLILGAPSTPVASSFIKSVIILWFSKSGPSFEVIGFAIYYGAILFKRSDKYLKPSSIRTLWFLLLLQAWLTKMSRI